MSAVCANPASMSGGSGALHAYLSSAGRGLGSSAEPRPWVTPAQPINTPFVSLPGLLTAECISNEKGSYLAVTVHGDPDDPRTLAREGLVGLGYDSAEAESMLEDAVAGAGDDAAPEELIAAALRTAVRAA